MSTVRRIVEPVFVEFGLLFVVLPALILGVAAQLIAQMTFARWRAVTTRTSGFAAARQVLDAAGLTHVKIEQIPGTLNDQYDVRGEILRLSPAAFHGRSITALGIATHEAGHALQHEAGYLALVVRGVAVPAAQYGSPCGLLLMLFGLAYPPLLLLGMGLYGAAVVLQIANLPVEFNASKRAYFALLDLEIIEENQLAVVRPVLNAAALANLAVTLQSLATLVSAIFRFIGRGENR